jgi:hypothetical protein
MEGTPSKCTGYSRKDLREQLYFETVLRIEEKIKLPVYLGLQARISEKRSNKKIMAIKTILYLVNRSLKQE